MRSCCILLRPAARPPEIAPETRTVTMVERTELAVNLTRKNYYMGRMAAYFHRKQRNGVAE